MKLLNFDIFIFLLFGRSGWGQTGHFMPLGRTMTLNAPGCPPPLDPPVMFCVGTYILYTSSLSLFSGFKIISIEGTWIYVVM